MCRFKIKLTKTSTGEFKELTYNKPRAMGLLVHILGSAQAVHRALAFSSRKRGYQTSVLSPDLKSFSLRVLQAPQA